jgi:hypothetical protein
MEHKTFIWSRCTRCEKNRLHRAVIIPLRGRLYSIRTACCQCGYFNERILTAPEISKEVKNALFH